MSEVSLALAPGRITGLIGPNGAGKTTALKLLMNLHPATSGEATVLGIDSRKLQGPHFEQVGYVSENQELPGWMTLKYLLGYLKAFYPTWDDERASELVAHFQLPLDRPIRHFSRGMQMKAALASSLCYHPKLLVLDEPTNGLDPEGIHEIRYLLIDLCRQEGKTVFVSSHNLAEMEMMADHIALIDKGRLIYEGALGTLLMTEQYVLRVRQGEKAEQLLEAEGLEFCKEAPGAFLVEIEQEEVPRLLRLMISQRIDVLEMARKKQTLEELFLSLVRDE